MKPIHYILLAAIPVFISGLEQSIMATSAASIARLAGVETAMAWILAAYFIAAAVASPVYGRLGDRYGAMRMLIVAIVIFACGSLLASQAGNFATLVGARFLQGLGGGGLIALPQAFLARKIEPRVRAAYQGYLVAVAFFANTFGPAVGGYLIGHFGWQSVFLLQLPLAGVAVVLLWLAPGDDAAENAGPLRFDWPGALLLIGTVTCLMCLTQSLRDPGRSTEAWLWALGLIAFGAAFAWVERRSADALIPPELLRRPIVWRSGLIVCCYGAVFTGLSSFLPVLLRRVYDLPLEQVGLMMMPLLGAVGVGSIITGQMVRRSGRTMIFPTLGLLTVASFLLCFSFAFRYLSPLQVTVWMGISGLFMGSTMGVVQVSMQVGAPAEMLGRASAFLQLSRTIGASLGAGLGAVIYFRGVGTTVGTTGQGLPGGLPGLEHGWTVFVVLFASYAMIALFASLTALSCRVPRLT